MIALIGIVFMVAGLSGVAYAAWKSHLTDRQLEFIRTLGQDAELDDNTVILPARVQTPLVNRVFGPASQQLRHSLSRLYPSRDIDRVHTDLLKAGLTGSVRAEEFVALQVASVLMGAAVGLTTLATGIGGVKLSLIILILLPMAGAIGPSDEGFA